MLQWLLDRPGQLYVLATLLPLLATGILLVAGGLRAAARPYRAAGFGRFLFAAMGGTQPGRWGGYLATAAIGGACVLSLLGLWYQLNPTLLKSNAKLHELWQGRTTWVSLSVPATDAAPLALQVDLGYRIDLLTALLFAMVTFVATLIHLFSIGYLADETKDSKEDHEVHTGHAHLHRRGRFGQFYLYLSLFCFSMLNLLVADNLLQVFISWELVGVCSFLLIGYYYERPSAAVAANKAFIVNRIGDVGLLVGIAILWSSVGTLNFEEIFHRVRCPELDSHKHHTPWAEGFVRGDLRPDGKLADVRANGDYLLIFPDHWHSEDLVETKGRPPRVTAALTPLDDSDFGVLPYWLFVVAGLGIFLGCVGKSAQFPLHVWLPDAMEGPTPVSVLIHAATMVAAGVYLVGRCFPLFAPEVLIVIAYTGAITLVLAACMALVMTDIKRVLAYSTVSQLGYMMLALGVGGWVAGELHLLTHAFFKALLFLGAGSVIHALHHQQDLLKMGGLWSKLPITAGTMLVGVLAISGTPLFSGWYSKDEILAATLGYALTHPAHWLLFLAPLVTAGLTAFYMFRLWFLAFAGAPRDAEVHHHAHESPLVMTLPLIVLALFSIGVAWDFRHGQLFKVEASTLAKLLHQAEPSSVHHDFASAHAAAHQYHTLAGVLALAVAGAGVVGAAAVYWLRRIDSDRVQSAFAFEHRLFSAKWYFDVLYDTVFVRPTLWLAYYCRVRDKLSDDPPLLAGEPAPTGYAWATLDGVASAPGQAVYAAGLGLRSLQTGSIRRYVLLLVLTTGALFAILSLLLNRPAVG